MDVFQRNFQIEMERGEFERKRRSGSVRAAINQFGDKVLDESPLKKTPHKDSSETTSSNRRELRKARRDISRYKESQNAAESTKADAELELLNAKNTVNSLSSLIDEPNSKGLAQSGDMETLKKLGRRKEQAILDISDIENNHYAEVMRELEFVKQEMSKLKLDMASVLREKSRAEKVKEASSSKLEIFSSSIEGLRKEIEEINEEQVLVELARIEALKEYREIEAEREKEAKEFSSAVEKKKKNITELSEEIESSKELEAKLDITKSDINLLQYQLNIIKEEMDKRAESNDKSTDFEGKSQREELEDSKLVLSITEELEAAKKELALIREEGFQFMSSMDVIRNELKHVKEETARIKKTEDKADLKVQNLNSKLLRAKAKLEAVSSAEEKAKSIVTNLSVTLEQLKTEVQAAKKEKELVSEETENIKAEIKKTEIEIDVTEEKLHEAVQELEEVKSSESAALENLKTLIDATMKIRASTSQHSSSITISQFEYEYLTGRAVKAEEIADKKVAAARAWIEALKASEKEILMKTELTQQEVKEMKEEEEKPAYRARRSLSAKGMVEGDNVQLALPAKSIKGYGNLTPSRRAKFRKSASPALGSANRSTSFTVKRRRKAMPNLAKLFGGN